MKAKPVIFTEFVFLAVVYIAGRLEGFLSPNSVWENTVVVGTFGLILVQLGYVTEFNPKLSSRDLLFVVFGLGCIGTIGVGLVGGYYHFGATEAIGLVTLAAEALGFIGLSLVELTIFLGARSSTKQTDLGSKSASPTSTGGTWSWVSRTQEVQLRRIRTARSPLTVSPKMT